ncbi:MAG: LacI family DNA-binding transcriptional regulator [Pseudomonadota bacterium]
MQANSRKTAVGDNERPVTIAQVAREAGVSKTSVSRFLGGELDALSDTIRHQVESTIKRLGYQPNQMARGLKRGRTRLIGMVVADVVNPYSIAVLKGAEAACQQNGYTLMLCNTGNDEQREKQSLAVLRSYSVEGIILHMQGRNQESLRELQHSGLPVVLIDRRLEGFDFDLVGLDNLQSARLATRHLVERGFTDIALVTAPLAGVSSRQGRAEGFKATLSEYPACHGEVIEADPDDSAAFDAKVTQFIARRGERRTALLAANGVVTLRIALLLQRLQVSMPDQLGLLGFDELDWSPLVGPGVSTIEQQTYDIGYTAMKCLLARLQGEQFAPREVLLKGKLIVRGSTGLVV